MLFLQFRHSISITQQLIPIYNATVHKNFSMFALNMAIAKRLVLWETNMDSMIMYTSSYTDVHKTCMV